jgi:hypothetical protein
MIIGIVGDIGSGKSHKQLKVALERCNKRQKRLVVNFRLVPEALKKYCASRKLWFAYQMIENGQYEILDCSNQDDVLKLLDVGRSVVCLDEAGIFFNSRGFQDTPKTVLKDLCQSRKQGTDLLWAAQFDSQVDKQFRMLTQSYIWCQGYSTWSRKLGNECLKWKSYHSFTSSDYESFAANPKARSSILKTVWSAFDNEMGPLSAADKLLFDCYESFQRLDENETRAKPMREKIDENDYYSVYRRCSNRSFVTRSYIHSSLKELSYSPASALYMTPRQLRFLLRSAFRLSQKKAS